VTGWLRHHIHSAQRALVRLVVAPLASLLNVLVLGIALAFPLLGYVALDNVRSMVPRIQAGTEVTAFLKPEVAAEERAPVERLLRSDPAVRRVRFVSRDEALVRLKATAGIADIASVLAENPLPDAFVATLSGSDPDAPARLAGGLRSLSAVGHVQADVAWARRLDSVLNAARVFVASLGILLGIAVLLVVFNTIRLQILTDSDEIEVAKLVGATDAYVRRPFLWWGSLLGMGGGLFAVGIVWMTLNALEPHLSSLATLYGSEVSLTLAPSPVMAFVAVSLVLGWVGAALSVSMYLQKIRVK
jgi:cell division transport system permease protein